MMSAEAAGPTTTPACAAAATRLSARAVCGRLTWLGLGLGLGLRLRLVP